MSWPRSLFARLMLLLLTVIVISLITTILLFRQDRANLFARQFADTKIAQIQALRHALSEAAPTERNRRLSRLGEDYGVKLIPYEKRPEIGRIPRAQRLQDLADILRERLGDDTELRIQGTVEQGTLWIKLMLNNEQAYWVGFPFSRQKQEELPLRLFGWLIFISILLLLSAYLFTRVLSRPLQQLGQAVAAVGQGQTPSPLPETGPTEIAKLSQTFNQMTASLQRMENDRALLLAGVSHDLRTPLSRLRLAVEMSRSDESEIKQGMVDDIEEIDKIIEQFLDFARGEEKLPLERINLNELIEPVAERYRRKGHKLLFSPGQLPPLSLRIAAIERLLNNLIDNAIRYGGGEVELATSYEVDAVILQVSDRGPGIPPQEVARLMQPFTRLSSARSGPSGAGLGLAIVDRIVKLHQGEWQILPRMGGGSVVKVMLPID